MSKEATKHYFQVVEDHLSNWFQVIYLPIHETNKVDRLTISLKCNSSTTTSSDLTTAKVTKARPSCHITARTISTKPHFLSKKVMKFDLYRTSLISISVNLASVLMSYLRCVTYLYASTVEAFFLKIKMFQPKKKSVSYNTSSTSL